MANTKQRQWSFWRALSHTALFGHFVCLTGLLLGDYGSDYVLLRGLCVSLVFFVSLFPVSYSSLFGLFLFAWLFSKERKKES